MLPARYHPEAARCGLVFVFHHSQETALNRTQIDLDDAVGKTITAVIELSCDMIFLAIGSDEFVVIEADLYDGDSAELDSSKRVQWSRQQMRIDDQKKVFDAETIAKWAEADAQNEIARKARQEAHDRKELERLKMKFGV